MSILGQQRDAAIEILVVDDGSTDRTADAVHDLATINPEVRLIRLERNHGRGYARNAGCDHATGRYVAYVDADIILPADWLSRCMRAMPDADVVGGIAIPDGDMTYVCRRFGLRPRAVPARAAITGNNGLYRRDLLRRYASIRSCATASVALSYELQARGARIVVIPDLLVRHEESKPLPGNTVAVPKRPRCSPSVRPLPRCSLP